MDTENKKEGETLSRLQILKKFSGEDYPEVSETLQKEETEEAETEASDKEMPETNFDSLARKRRNGIVGDEAENMAKMAAEQYEKEMAAEKSAYEERYNNDFFLKGNHVPCCYKPKSPLTIVTMNVISLLLIGVVSFIIYSTMKMICYSIAATV